MKKLTEKEFEFKKKESELWLDKPITWDVILDYTLRSIDQDIMDITVSRESFGEPIEQNVHFMDKMYRMKLFLKDNGIEGI
jgi:hypothetical protein